jgi:hypothetical protein
MSISQLNLWNQNQVNSIITKKEMMTDLYLVLLNTQDLSV